MWVMARTLPSKSFPIHLLLYQPTLYCLDIEKGVIKRKNHTQYFIIRNIFLRVLRRARGSVIVLPVKELPVAAQTANSDYLSAWHKSTTAHLSARQRS